jgi:hypothetical protein
MLAEVVVFPTPPLPEVTTIVSDNSGFSYAKILGAADMKVAGSVFQQPDDCN